MPSAPPINRYNPSFLRYPIQNNRTGFQPVYLPLILIVPGRRTASGHGISNSDVSDVKFYIAEAPDPAIVVGHQYITGVSETEIQHLTIPDLKELFTLNVTRLQLVDVQITLQGLTFTGANGNTKTFDEAVEGDVFTYTTINGNITSTIPYFPDADYYDVSKFTIGVDDLPMPLTYLFVWQCSYKRRTTLPDNIAISEGPFCITDKNAISRFNILIQHPGDVHHEMFRKTPPFYFESEGASLASQIGQSNILKFYRPFADILQDIADEQSFINGINHINRIPAQLIPYLAYIIGWDLPNFPKVTDTLRRSILRQAVELQKLKGTRLAITELFEIFGFTIDLINLWYSTNGKRLIAPGETLPATLKAEEITVQTVCQIDLLLNRYNTSGFGQFTIPLLYKSTGNITINAWLVEPGPTDTALTNITDELISDPDDLVGQCETSAEGFLIPRGIIDTLPSSDDTVLGTAEVLIDFESGTGELVMNSSNPILNKTNIKYDKVTNLLTLNFDHYLDFSDGSFIYVFATYPRTKLGIPSELSNSRSNRFDIEIFSKSDEESVDTDIIEYLLNFLFDLKAFHSLLRRIVFRVNLVDVYNVTDYCSPFNTLELPPPVIRPDLSGCPQVLPNDESTKFRNKLYDALTAEHEAWKLLDDTHQTTQQERDNSKLPVNAPVGEECQFNPYGQDRVYQNDSLNLDIDPDTREKACVLTEPSAAFCFKGRVKDELEVNPVMLLQEIVRCVPCALSVGSGVYYLLPTNAKILMENGFGKFNGQNNFSFLGKKIAQFGKPLPVALHYTNRPYLTDYEFENNQLLGYQRPNLEIQKDNFGMPAHRFIALNKLENDYTSSWKAKPWDFETDELNAHLTTGTDGNQYIVYDDAPNTYDGNGLVQDISSYGEHAERPFISTHKIFMVTAPGHPAITLDGVVETEDEEIEIGTTGPIFRSYNQSCNKDFRNGYPAEFGRFDVDMSEHDFNRGDGTDLIGELLGIPTERTDISGLTALFTYGSQILLDEDDFEYAYYRPYRYDCECERFGCSGTGSSGTSGTAGTDPTFRTNLDTCLLNKYLLPDGSHDFNCDQLSLNVKMLLNEHIGLCSFKYDKEISNSICILISPDGTLPLDEAIPPVGLIHYIDGYGVIYETTWTFENSILDIKTTIKSPHVWGQPDEGYVEGLKVFRRGIVTTTSKKIRVNADGTYEVLVIYQEEQFIAFFQSNVTCFDMPFVDNFCFHFNCSVDDQLDVLVTCGSRWVEPSDTQVEWPDLIVDSAGVVVGYTVSSGGIQPFLWVNVFDNDDALMHICEGDTILEFISPAALKGIDGAVWMWGINSSGTCGDNTASHRSSPVSVVGNHSFIHIGNFNYNNTFAVKEDGSVWGWGRGTFGRLGTNEAVNRSSPVSVVGGHSFIEVTAYNPRALKADGTIWSWGRNSGGSLGDNTTTDKSSPVSVVGNHSFISIGGVYHVLKADGSVWGWGRNLNGALGDDTTSNRSSPVSVVGNHSFIQIVGPIFYFGAGLKDDGSVWCWGRNVYGQLGQNNVTHRSSPVSVIGGHSFVDISGGLYYMLCRKADGSLWSWGYNGFGQLGDGTTNYRSSPVSVLGGLFTKLGKMGRIAQKSGGSLWSWGFNGVGNVGDGTASSRSSPVKVIGLTAF